VDLTPLEQQVYDLRSQDTKLTMREIGEQLGMTTHRVNSTWKRVREKVGIEPSQGRDTDGIKIEYKDPEAAAAFMDLVTEPGFEGVAEAAKESGLPLRAAQGLVNRMQENYEPVKREVDRIKTDTFVKKAEFLALRFWDSITDEDIKSIDAYKRVIAGAILVDKRELLDGRPTERISVEDRRALPDIMAALLKEAQVRGLMPEVNPETQKVHLGHREDAPYQVRAGRERMAPVDTEIA